MRATYLEVLVAEESMKRLLQQVLPRIIDVPFRVIAFSGKTDLLTKLPGLLEAYRGWFGGEQRLLIVVDRDDKDCRDLKRRLETMAGQAGLTLCHVSRHEPGVVLNRIAVEELEAWFIGDVAALSSAYPRVPESLAGRRRFRQSDSGGGTWEALEKVLNEAGYHRGGLRKIALAEDVGPHLNLDNNRSHSFRAFVVGVRYLIEGAA